MIFQLKISMNNFNEISTFINTDLVKFDLISRGKKLLEIKNTKTKIDFTVKSKRKIFIRKTKKKSNN